MSKKKTESRAPNSAASSSPAKFDYQLDRLFHEKARLGILTCLISQPAGLAFIDLKQSCGLSDGNLNRHLQVLMEADCLNVEKNGAGRTATTIYQINAQGRKAFALYLQELERVLADAQKAAESAKTIKQKYSSIRSGSARPKKSSGNYGLT